MAGEPVQRRLQFVLEHYDKRPTENVILNYFGMANEVYTITTNDGRFVVKNCFKNNTHERVANEAALMTHLKNRNVPCPALVPTKTGEPFLNYDGHFYIMSEFVEGHTPTWEEPISYEIVQETIRAMADFHSATEDFAPPYEVDSIGTFEIPKILDWLDDLLKKLTSTDTDRASIVKMKPVIQQLQVHALKLQEKLAHLDISMVSPGYIHGDMHCFNLIFDADRKNYNAIVDFDFSRMDYRLVDIYGATRTLMGHYWFPKLFGFKPFRNNQIPTPEQTKEATQAVVKDLVQNYRKHHDLPDFELGLLPLFAEALPLYTVRFFNLGNSEEECLNHAQWFQFQLDHLEQNVSNFESAVALCKAN